MGKTMELSNTTTTKEQKMSDWEYIAALEEDGELDYFYKPYDATKDPECQRVLAEVKARQAELNKNANNGNWQTYILEIN